jgi:hypothetical protein
MQRKRSWRVMARRAGKALLVCAWLGWSAAYGQASPTGDFVADPKSGCKVWNPHPLADETVSWSGGCVDGLAQGAGSLQWQRGGKAYEKDDGEWNMGRQSGSGTQDWSSGRYQGELLNSEPHGQGVMTLQSARYEGEFRDGKAEGNGSVTNLEGVFKGRWKQGCLIGDKRKISFAVPSSTCR